MDARVRTVGVSLRDGCHCGAPPKTSSRLRDQAASHVHNKDELLMLAARVIAGGF